jgi:hypothetical protein
MKKQERFTVFELIQTTAFALLFMGITYMQIRAGAYWVALIPAAFALLIVWVLADVRHGLRPMTHYERFESWYYGLSVSIFIGGGALLGGLAYAEISLPAPLALFVIFSWLGISLYTMRYVRGRGESIAYYKQRMNYVEPPSQSKPTKKE